MFSKNIKNNIWYGNELSEYDTVQIYCTSWWWTILNSCALCAAWLLYQSATSESGSYDAGVTCMSRVIISTLHWSVLTVYSKCRPPESAYALRNEQGFRTPGVFSCNAFSFRSSSSYRWLTSKHLLCQRLQTTLEQRDGWSRGTSVPAHVPPREHTAAGCGTCWNAHRTRCSQPGKKGKGSGFI